MAIFEETQNYPAWVVGRGGKNIGLAIEVAIRVFRKHADSRNKWKYIS
jgi:hypothetical protein